ncbi:MAG: GSCFA domain-containing protein [Bacteroidaceae bacterium]|nr:GSCFA domain-containing protein [Bacteroidaceae bacterium]
MNLFTSVNISKISPQLGYADALLMMGSCFVTEMGKRLQGVKLRCKVNPFGVLYNPLSIASSLGMLLKHQFPTNDDFVYHEGCWHSLSFHGDFSAPTQQELMANIHQSLDDCQEILQQISCLLITFGSAYVYERKLTGKVVANCHKLPEKLFSRRRLSVDEIVRTYRSVLSAIWEVNPSCRILFTVSPIRHVRDGLHENQLSKATLLLAIDELKQLFPSQVLYFPAYELLMDELRDYRFYADDLVHPSEMAVEYIWQRFTTAYFTQEAIETMESVKEIKKMMEHRPLHPESKEYARFLHQIVLKIETLSEKYPYFDFEKEKESCLTKLNRLH